MNQSKSCQQVSADQLNQLIEGLLSTEQTEAIETHLEQCADCHDRLMVVAGGPTFLAEAHTQLSDVHELPTLYAEQANDIADSHAVRIERLLKEIPLAPTDDPQMLGRIGGYEICGLVGRGGMGVVLKGWDAALDRFVAIKVLSPVYAHQDEMRLRFAREAKAAAAVVHENVVAIFGVDSFHDLPYLVMPYVRGESLQNRMDRVGKLPLEEVIEIALQVARGLQAAHDQGVVHRDIKPANILIPRSVSRVMITDFGLARAIDDSTLTHSGLVAGTPAYMSPEQAKGEAVYTQSDLFSLGSVIYAMCCGEPPFKTDGSYATLRRIIDEAHPPLGIRRPDLPRWWIDIVDRCLAKKPAQRYASAAELAKDLEQALVYLRQPQLASPPQGKSRLRTVLASVSVVAVMLVVAMGFAWWNGFGWLLDGSAATALERSSRLETELNQDLEQLENESSC